jgi:hypothetical protein
MIAYRLFNRYVHEYTPFVCGRLVLFNRESAVRQLKRLNREAKTERYELSVFELNRINTLRETYLDPGEVRKGR